MEKPTKVGWFPDVASAVSILILRIGIEPTGRKAKWTAAALFKLDEDGKIIL